MASKRRLTMGIAADPDDAFRWYAMVAPGVAERLPSASAFEFEPVIEDIQSLNRRAEDAELAISALSIYQYAHVASEYLLSSCGWTISQCRGPLLIARRGAGCGVEQLSQCRLAMPGERTTVLLATAVLLDRSGAAAPAMMDRCVNTPDVLGALRRGEADAGVLIHADQLMWSEEEFEVVVDLGRWWHEHFAMPLPLACMVIRRDLAAEAATVCSLMQQSIYYALQHRDQASAYAMQFAGELDEPMADRFVSMHVNQWSIDCGAVGEQAVRCLIDAGVQVGLLERTLPLQMVRPDVTVEQPLE